MTLDVHYRAVELSDYSATQEVVVEAFEADGEVTAAYLDARRADGCVLGEWLAEDLRGLIAHIVFSRVWVERPDGSRHEAAMLTPLAVRRGRH
jgi:predicted N-acetyltransferase YhbS